MDTSTITVTYDRVFEPTYEVVLPATISLADSSVSEIPVVIGNWNEDDTEVLPGDSIGSMMLDSVNGEGSQQVIAQLMDRVDEKPEVDVEYKGEVVIGIFNELE